MLRHFFDKIGIFLSTLCLVHCLLIPVLFALYPAAPLFWGELHEKMHEVLFFIILPTCLLAFYPRFYKEKMWEFFWGPMFAIGIFWITLMLTEKKLLPYVNITEPMLTSVGSLTLIYFHWKNFKHLKVKCKNPECHH